MGPVAEAAEGFAKGFQAVYSARFSQCLVESGLLERVVFCEEKANPRRHVAKVLDLGFDDRERTEQRLARAVGDPRFFHKGKGKFVEAFQAHVEDVLAIE